MSKTSLSQKSQFQAAHAYPRRLRTPRVARRGVILAVILAGMVLLLLMLGGLARRVMIEHRAIDLRAQSLQADWLLWSAKQRVELQLRQGKRDREEWKLTPSDPNLGKLITARVLDQVADGAAPSEADKTSKQIELRWTTATGLVLERSTQIEQPANQTKGAP